MSTIKPEQYEQYVASRLVQAIDRAAGFDAERRAEGQRKFLDSLTR